MKTNKCEICGKQISVCGMKSHLDHHKTEKPCGFCGKVVVGKKKFCDSSCAARYNKNRIGTGRVHVCVCGKSARVKYCSLGCKNKTEYEEYIKRWLDGKESGLVKGERGGISNYVRKWLFERANNKCEGILDDGSRCGWSRVNPKTGKIPLTIHHRDGNWRIHRPEDMEVLCPSCHSITETYGALNKGKGRRRD